ncbi:MAG: CHAD domain-containing protein [Acidimicrobiales bacterium]
MGSGKDRVDNSAAPRSSDVVRLFVGNEVGNLLHFDPLAREGANPEGVHQLRVSSRRLRAELMLMKPVLRPEALTHLLVELKWLGKTLGRRRDLDVRTSLVSRVARGFPTWLAAELRAQLDDQARREDEKVQRLLTSDRYQHLMATLAEAVVRPPLNAQASIAAADVLMVGLRDALGALVEGTESFGPKPNFEQLHDIRILAKRVRYSAVLAALVFGSPAEELASSLEKVQSVLGDLHDRVLVLDYLNQVFDELQEKGPSADLKRARASTQRTFDREIKRLSTQWRLPYDEARRRGMALCRRDSR